MTELRIIRERLCDLIWNGYLRETVIPLPVKDHGYLETLVPGDLPGTLCWEDIDYSDRSATKWKPSLHIRRLLEILYANGKEAVSDPAVREKILSAIRYFIAHDFHSTNWWHNMIGMPRDMSDLSLMLGDAMPKDVLDDLLVLLRRGSLGSLPPEKHMTGANRIWLGATTLRIALLTDDEDLMRLGCDRISEEVKFLNEGVQHDGSFFQHGPRLYSGGYGRCFAYDMAQLMYILDGTSYMFTKEQCAVVETHIADGLRYMTHRGILDYQCLGRNYTREENQDPGILRIAVELLSRVSGLSRHDEIAAYRDSITDKLPFEGTRYFPDAAALCHHTGNLYVGTKFLAPGLLDEEICNQEGVLGYNLSYGTHHCVMVTGREYFDITPVWQYDRMPGTTARAETDEELLAHDPSWANVKRELPGGGCQKGDLAVIWEDMKHDTVSGCVADFAFPGGFVSMNACLSDSEGKPLYTTLDQCFASRPWEIDGTSVIHGGIRYTALDESVLTPEIRRVAGSWKRNNLTSSPAPVEADLFSLTVCHPEGKGSCAYMISAADTPAPAVLLLANDEKAQALLLPDGRVMAVFRDECTLNLPDGRTIRGTKGEYIG